MTTPSTSVLKCLFSAWARVCTSEYEIKLFHAASLVAYFAPLRISERVASSKTDKLARALPWGDVLLRGGQLTLHVRVSKTNQLGKGRSIQLDDCADETLCPVQGVEQYVTVRRADPGYFFQHADRVPLTRYQFWEVTSKALESMGLKGVRFGTHSFRVRAASTLAQMGYPQAY